MLKKFEIGYAENHKGGKLNNDRISNWICGDVHGDNRCAVFKRYLGLGVGDVEEEG